MNNTVLECSGLYKEYDEGIKTAVLKGVSLSLEEGESIAIVGASGSGKSTLLQILGGLDTPTRGSVQVKGKDIHALSAKACGDWRNQHLGFVYQFHHLLPDFTALENVMISTQINGLGYKEASEKARAVLEQLGLSERLDHPPSKLSGGEQQRVAIARAIVGEPALLLADEPTGNLDEETAGRVLDLLLETVRDHKLAVLMATHDKNIAARLDRQLVLQEGVLQGS